MSYYTRRVPARELQVGDYCLYGTVTAITPNGVQPDRYVNVTTDNGLGPMPLLSNSKVKVR